MGAPLDFTSYHQADAIAQFYDTVGLAPPPPGVHVDPEFYEALEELKEAIHGRPSNPSDDQV